MASVPPTTPETSTPLRLITLGEARLCAPGGVELLAPGKPLALLIYLACAPSRTVRREQLLTLLWADLPPDKARHALRQTLWFLRQLLGVDRLKTQGSELNLTGSFAIDREEFLAALERREFEPAVVCYRGNFLEGFAVPGGLDFEHWADVERQRLREAFLRSGEHLARHWMDQGRARDAVQLARRVRDAAPGVERAWRLLLESLRSADDRLNFGMEAAALERLFSDEGRVPEAATRVLLEGESQRATETADPVRVLQPALVGREREFAAMLRAWDLVKKSGGRHFHLSAPPGLGKSRLLQEVHRRLRSLGTPALLLRANPGDQAIPFSLAGEIVRILIELPGASGVSPAAAGALVALYPPLSARFHAPPDLATGDDALAHRASAIAELLEAVCDEGPIALLLDDLHWADRASRQLLLPLVARLERMRVLLVSATRPSGELTAFGQTGESIQLAPISVSNIVELLISLAQLPDEDWAAELPAVLREVSGGTPLMVLEALQLALDRGLLVLSAQRWECPDPPALFRQLHAGGALQSRINRLDPESRWILLILATAGVPLAVPEIASVAARSLEASELALHGLEQAGMIRRVGETWQPVHDEIADRVLSSAGQTERSAAHRGLGESLYTREGTTTIDLARAGQHLVAAGEQSILPAAFVRYVRLRRQEGDRRRLGFLAQQFLQGRSEEEVTRLLRTMGRLNRLRYSSGVRTGVAAGMALGLVMAGWLGVSWLRRPEITLMLRINRQEADDTVYALPLIRSEWVPEGPIDISRLPNVGQPVRMAGTKLWVNGADPDDWYQVRLTSNYATNDIFRLRGNRIDTIAAFRHDDDNPAPSPDGKYVVFTTSHFSRDTRDDNYDLAIRDLETGVVSQLTSGPEMDQQAGYSPDGMRIAFARRVSVLRSNLCWMVPQPGVTPACLDLNLNLVGWLDDTSLLAIQPDGSKSVLVSVDLASGHTIPLRNGVTLAFLSPDSRWMLFRSVNSAGAQTWMLAPVGDLGSARELTHAPASNDGLQPYWTFGRSSPKYATSIAIVSPEKSIGLTVAHRLGIRARTVNGELRDVVGVWRSRNESVASVDAQGVVHPQQAGQVTIVAQSGSFADSVTLTISPLVAHPVMQEDWSKPLTVSWIPFGDPRPEIVPWPEGGRAFRNNGEGSFGSGAYLRQGFKADQGVGLEARLQLKVTRTNWQQITLELAAGLDSSSFGSWDHLTGPFPPLALPYSRRCGAAYPTGEGAGHDTLISPLGGATGHALRVSPKLGKGQIFRLRIQLFPDGRCGIAIDGRPVWRSATPIDMVSPVSIVLGYSSVDTDALIGPMEVWQGVKPDVSWNSIDPEFVEGGQASN